MHNGNENTNPVVENKKENWFIDNSWRLLFVAGIFLSMCFISNGILALANKTQASNLDIGFGIAGICVGVFMGLSAVLNLFIKRKVTNRKLAGVVAMISLMMLVCLFLLAGLTLIRFYLSIGK